MSDYKRRMSGVELLKIIAILMIILSHAAQSAGVMESPFIPSPLKYGVDIDHTTTEISVLLFIIFRHFGAIGNAIFFVSSAWFLCDSDCINLKKVVHMEMDVIFFSLAILGIFIPLRGGVNIDGKTIIASLFPTTFTNNWYVTGYMLIYIFHSGLNVIIRKLDRLDHAKIAVFLFVIYSLIGTVSTEAFFYTNIMFFIAVYFVVAFVKKYREDLWNDLRLNYIVLMISALCLLTGIIAINTVGRYFHLPDGTVRILARTCNPLAVIIAFSAFHVARSGKLKSNAINWLSGLSMLIYIFHDNLLIRGIIRPLFWNWLCRTFSNNNIVINLVIFASVITMISFICTSIYRLTVQKPLYLLSDAVYIKLNKMISSVFKKL